ncbi:hypothetical protein [Arthrobacter sp. P2b]|uniref:hypothetical protein n=1 Tax=Arthrobacter sp. P2b TaxID=1938741 RepID=UPI0009CB9E70|nr:hypothetical protein [Arthrobacter sp. P2b]SLK12884.1 hypothetical protein SAMN06272721_11771 [Arthrobacter sp. P2b]
MIHRLTQATPTPHPSFNSSVPSLFDAKDYVTAIAATLSVTLILGFVAVIKRAKIGTVFKRLGSFVTDRWNRLKTPVDTIPDLEQRLQAAEEEATAHQKAREVAVQQLDDVKSKFRSFRSTTRTLDDLGEEEFKAWCEANGYEASRSHKPKLPARWTCKVHWAGGSGLNPSNIVLTNIGPGAAFHVLLDAGNNIGAPQGETYWEEVGPGESRSSEVLPRSVRRWGGQPVLKLSWRNEDGQEQSQGLTLSKPPHVRELEDDPTVD